MPKLQNKMEKSEWVEEKLQGFTERHLLKYGYPMPAHNQQTLRLVLGKEFDLEERAAELSLRDYAPQDEGMHWSD